MALLPSRPCRPRPERGRSSGCAHGRPLPTSGCAHAFGGPHVVTRLPLLLQSSGRHSLLDGGNRRSAWQIRPLTFAVATSRQTPTIVGERCAQPHYAESVGERNRETVVVQYRDGSWELTVEPPPPGGKTLTFATRHLADDAANRLARMLDADVAYRP